MTVDYVWWAGAQWHSGIWYWEVHFLSVRAGIQGLEF